METMYVDYWQKDEMHRLYPQRTIGNHLKHVPWWCRFIQMATAYHQTGLGHLHYEVCPSGYIELHFEGGYDQKYADLAQYLYLKTKDDQHLNWFPRHPYGIGCCRYETFLDDANNNEEPDFFRDVFCKFVDLMDKLLLDYKEQMENPYTDNYDEKRISSIAEPRKMDDVSLADNLTLNDIFHLNINIPDYQRIYSWQEKNVRRLLEDIFEADNDYRMGAIILHKHDNMFDIIDGQQRLVTLSLILRKMGYDGSPLLKLKFQSSEAMHYVAFNRSIIDNYINTHVLYDRLQRIKFLLNHLQFSVLILDTDNIDLAYTFFSNENSRGKSLSDFDLLKAHHLRYIFDESQAEHLASRWDNMLYESQELENDYDKPYFRALGMYIFRLRNWMRMELWDDFEKYRIKTEYEAAPFIDEIPPFGESFFFNESIQGGAHFFAFVKQFDYKYRQFIETDEFKAIHKLESRTHWWFRDVIETFLFAYYLKFGVDYLSEALVAISRIIAQFRFDFKKADYGRLLHQAGESGIVFMIDRATSPTFALAEMLRKVKTLPAINVDIENISKDFYRLIVNYLYPIKKKIIIDKFKQIL